MQCVQYRLVVPARCQATCTGINDFESLFASSTTDAAGSGPQIRPQPPPGERHRQPAPIWRSDGDPDVPWRTPRSGRYGIATTRWASLMPRLDDVDSQRRWRKRRSSASVVVALLRRIQSLPLTMVLRQISSASIFHTHRGDGVPLLAPSAPRSRSMPFNPAARGAP